LRSIHSLFCEKFCGQPKEFTTAMNVLQPKGLITGDFNTTTDLDSVDTVRLRAGLAVKGYMFCPKQT